MRTTAIKDLRIAFFNLSDLSSGAESLIRATVEGLLRRGIDARLYAHYRQSGAPYVFPYPFYRYEQRIEQTLRRVTGRNDFFFPSTWRLGRQDWLKDANIWHFHNLHGHYLSIPLLASQSRKHLTVLSPVDQFLSTGYCPYTLGCERFRDACGNCPQLDLPYPGISRDTTSELLRMKKAAVRSSDFKLLVHTDFLAQHYQSTFVGALPITRLYYGVDTEVFKPMDRLACAEALGIENSQRFVVGIFHSSITEERKGFLPLLRQLRELAESRPERIEVLVVGHESEKARTFETPNLRVTAMPFLKSETELAIALNLCDVLLYPTQAENLSLTCLNALACGVPVISSRVGGQGEAVNDGVNGYLCDAVESSQFIDRIAMMSGNPDLVEQLSVGARRTAVERFDINNYVDNLVHYYQDLVANRPAHA